MLVLSRKENEVVHIGKDITVTVVSVRGNKVKLAFNAPMEVPIHRAEVHQRLEQEDFATATGRG
ncbi:MAG: hypothetical protein RIS70_2205 [Planctomycetota bacterium]|jgi:carbon storage regulator